MAKRTAFRLGRVHEAQAFYDDENLTLVEEYVL